MRGTPKRSSRAIFHASARLVPAVLLLSASFAAPPAAAFDLFGIHLWGERKSDDDVLEIADPLTYSAEIRAPDDVKKTVENASSLWTNQETPAAGKAGLLSKGRGDYRRILGALYTEGYFGAGVSIRLGSAEVADLTLASELPPEPKVIITVEPGNRFRFGRAEIVNAPPQVVVNNEEFDTPASVGYAPGEEAKTSAIDAASKQAVGQWRQLGRAKARESGRDVIANHPRQTLDSTLTLEPGPVVRYGTVTAQGSERIDHDFITYMADLPRGEVYDPEEVADARDRLSQLGAFDSIRLNESDLLTNDGLMPIGITVEDRKRRGIGFGGTYSTIDGLGLSAYWLHRNLFGRAERLRFDASIEGLISSSSWKDYNYNFGATFTKPGVFTPDTNFTTSLVASQLDYDTYRQTSITGQAGFSRQFTRSLSGELYGQISKARYEDDFGKRNFFTFGLIGRGAYDRRDNEFNATRGYYLAAELMPYYEADYGNFAARGTLEGRAYHGFGEEKDVVIAGRLKVGSFVGSSVEETPPDILFFAGGGGSIRGYAYRSIGVDTVNSDGETVVAGGKSLAEGSAELRWRFAGNFGAVGFVDAGFVNAGSDFMDDSDLRIGTGLGARYYTSFGPLRLDVAVPLDKRPEDDAFGVYIGIGQAF